MFTAIFTFHFLVALIAPLWHFFYARLVQVANVHLIIGYLFLSKLTDRSITVWTIDWWNQTYFKTTFCCIVFIPKLSKNMVLGEIWSWIPILLWDRNLQIGGYFIAHCDINNQNHVFTWDSDINITIWVWEMIILYIKCWWFLSHLWCFKFWKGH